MFLHLVKRFKPFALLVLLFFLSLLYTLNSFVNVKNKVVKDFLHPKLIDNEAAHFDNNFQLFEPVSKRNSHNTKRQRRRTLEKRL